MPWGWLCSLDLGGCDPEAIRSAERIKDFSTMLVERIDMKAFGDPIIVHFGSDDKSGYTLLQLIETSCISAHFSEDSNSAYIDVFSCKPFQEEDVIQTCVEYFGATTVKTHMIERQA